MRIIFMGTPEFALASLKELDEGGIEIAAVVTQADKPQGRGNKVVFSPVKLYALEKNFPLFQPARVEHINNLLRAIAPDFLVVVAFGQILKPETLAIPKKAPINLHASLLPLYRGASPIQCAIINGEKESGVTTMIMDEGMDTGPVLLQDTVEIEDDDTATTLHDKLAEAGASLLLRTLKEFDDIKPIPQPNCIATCSPLLCRGHGLIDWTRAAVEIYNLVRGCECWPSAFTRFAGKRIIVWAGVSTGDTVPDGMEPGTVIAVTERGIEVATGWGVFAVTELQREGKKRQKSDEFVRGFPLKTGDQFSSES